MFSKTQNAHMVQPAKIYQSAKLPIHEQATVRVFIHPNGRVLSMRRVSRDSFETILLDPVKKREIAKRYVTVVDHAEPVPFMTESMICFDQSGKDSKYESIRNSKLVLNANTLAEVDCFKAPFQFSQAVALNHNVCMTVETMKDVTDEKKSCTVVMTHDLEKKQYNRVSSAPIPINSSVDFQILTQRSILYL